VNAHGITHVALAHVEGEHLSEAPNAPTFAAIEAEANESAREIVAQPTAAEMRREHQQLERQVQANRQDPLLKGLYE